MNEKEPTFIDPNSEVGDIIKKQKDETRDKLGLPHDATTEEVFAEFGKRYNLPAGSTPEQVALGMLTDLMKDLNDFNNQLNEIKEAKNKLFTTPRRLLGKVATFLGLQKATTKPTNLVD